MINMKRFTRNVYSAFALSALIAAASCKKNDTVSVSTPPFQAGQPVSSASPLSGSIKGTMLQGQTYTVAGDITVNAGDTLVIQPGVTVKITGKYDFIVKGTFLSLGTQAAPIWITSGTAHQDQPFSSITASLSSDPAYQGQWYGINCDTTCALFVMKWTHVEFGGATFASTPPVAGTTVGTASFLIMFQNINGIFDMEDSWIYGSTDDAVRITDGKINVMRNTFEKCGSNTGEALNVKSGTVGDIAYNLFVGAATNGTKMSNAGATAIEANLHCYNNTYVDCGYRSDTYAGHGGSIDLEKQGKAYIYNNLIVNSRVGLRIVNTADTTNSQYGNTYNYGDSLSVANQFYSVGDATHPQTTDIPTPSSYLPSGYTEGAVYDGSSVVSVGNPQFKNFTLPNYKYQQYDFASGFDFHLASNSPAIAKGYTSFAPLGVVPVSANFGATAVDAPGADMGCYQSNGTGNLH
jgi:hypothetical protein